MFPEFHGSHIENTLDASQKSFSSILHVGWFFKLMLYISINNFSVMPGHFPLFMV